MTIVTSHPRLRRRGRAGGVHRRRRDDDTLFRHPLRTRDRDEDDTGAVRLRWRDGGATRDEGVKGTLVYLHGDHLGNVSVATSSTRAVLDRQEYGPWGNLRSGGVTETTLNYTGQVRDGTRVLPRPILRSQIGAVPVAGQHGGEPGEPADAQSVRVCGQQPA